MSNGTVEDLSKEFLSGRYNYKQQDRFIGWLTTWKIGIVKEKELPIFNSLSTQISPP